METIGLIGSEGAHGRMSEDNLMAAAEVVQARRFTGTINAAIVLGSGMSSAIEGIKEIVSIPYADLPGFPELHVSTHIPTLVIGERGGECCLHVGPRALL